MASHPKAVRRGRTGFNEVRENAILVSENVCSDETMQSSRRKTRLPTTKCDLPVGGRVLRRQNAIVSSENATSDEKTQSIRQLHIRRARICIHWEFSSDYRGDCFSFAAKKFSCPNNFW